MVIVYFSEKKIRPKISKWSDENSVVLSSTHDRIKGERDSLLKDLDTEREAKIKLEISTKQKISQIESERDTHISNFNLQIANQEKEILELSQKLTVKMTVQK